MIVRRQNATGQLHVCLHSNELTYNKNLSTANVATNTGSQLLHWHDVVQLNRQCRMTFLPYLLCKSHFKHAICFIKHAVLHPTQAEP